MLTTFTNIRVSGPWWCFLLNIIFWSHYIFMLPDNVFHTSLGNSFLPAGMFSFAGTSLSLLLDNRHAVVYSLISFFSKIDTKLKQINSQNIEDKLLYCIHCHTNAWSGLMSLFYYSQLRFYYATLLDRNKKKIWKRFTSPGIYKSSCSLRFDEDDDIFEP